MNDLSVAQRYSLAAVVKIVGAQDAEDVLQEAALRTLTTKARFRGRSSFNTWFYRVAIREALMHLRLAAHKRRHEELHDVYASDEPTPEEQAAQAETAARVYDAISRLSTRKRKLAALRWLAGETARGAEKAARHKAKVALREMLA